MTRKERAEEIERAATDLYDGPFMRVVSAMHTLEELGCKKECKELDTICGKLEHVCNKLIDKARGLA